jgi:chitinase
MKYFIQQIVFIFFVGISMLSHAQNAKANKHFAVIGYFAGRTTLIDSFPVEKLTHLIFSFTHLKGNQMYVSNARDTATIQKMIALKKTKNPNLKVIISLGGWTGCYTCSDVFKTDSTRKEFAGSVKHILNYFSADGFDLDWEYPVIPGPPGHPFSTADKDDLTALLKTLKDSLGKHKELSFAAGGFTKFINESVDWKQVVKYVDRINLMTYDLITGNDTVTGHHTALYSNPLQKESTDNAVQMLINRHIPANKLVIGAAFYARIWENVSAENNGLYQHGKFRAGISSRNFNSAFSKDSGFAFHWDSVSNSPYYYNSSKNWFATFDDPTSIRLKTEYAIKHKLNGIMFWQLADDSFFNNGLLDVIDEIKKKYR